MKICQFVLGHLPPGGLEYVVHHLSNALVKLGHEVTVFARSARKKVGILDLEKTDYEVFRYWLPRSKGFFHELMIKIMLRNEMKGEKFDIIHAHEIYPAGYWVLKSLNDFKNRIVITTHGGDIQVEPDYNYGSRLNSRVDERARLALKEGQYFTAVTNFLGTQMVALGASEDHVKIIPNGVNLELFNRKDAFKPPRPYLFSMGRLILIKGYDILIEAFARVAEEDPNLDLIIAGRGVEGRNLKDLVIKRGLEERVKFVGFVRGDEKTSLLKGCKFYVCPSRIEHLALGNVEGLAAGKPVVAFNTGGNPDIIKDGKNGLLAEPEDIEDLASKMQMLLRDEKLRERMSRQALIMVKRYDWREVARQYESLYKEMISRS
jgi:glycosyltransferase involved in cell wall biosynthesis